MKTEKDSRIFASVIIAWFMTIILGSLTGFWIKLFWLGWVLK
jgi:hypothetical protein